MSDSEQPKQAVQDVQNQFGRRLEKSYKEHLIENPLVALG